MASIPLAGQFKVTSELVLVDVTVLDRKGNPVRGLKPEQFQILEDNQPQKISLFEFQDIAARQAEPELPPETPGKQVIRILPTAPKEFSAPVVKDRRLIFLFFDSSSLAPEDLARARESAEDFLRKQMTAADLVAVGALGNTMRVLESFTNDRDALARALKRIVPGEGAALGEEGAAPDPDAVPDENDAGFAADETELNIFNTDRKLGAIEALARSLRVIPGKKMLIHFSGGVATTGRDNQSQLRAAVDAANRANVSIYTADVRGLVATVPGGDARAEFTRGTDLFSGRVQMRQRDRFLNTQDTLYTIAEDTGGKALLDTNDLGEVFRQVQQDSVGYYLLGYYTQNPASDGRFRRLKVTVNAPNARVRYRPGYFAPKEYRFFTREEREQQLREALSADMPFLDLRLAAGVDYFLHSDRETLVSVSVKVPGSQLSPPAAGEQLEFDLLGEVRTYEGRPAATLRDTVRVRWEGETIARVKAGGVQYDGGFRLRPGDYQMKLLVRDNKTGKIGTFEQPLVVPNLNEHPVTLSSVVLGTTAREDKVVPSVTRVFRDDQELLVYFQAYRPGVGPESNAPQLSAGLLFFRGGQKVSETPLEQVRDFADRNRRAASFRLRVPLKGFAPGRYWLQVNVLDHAGGRASFGRVPFAILAASPPASSK